MPTDNSQRLDRNHAIIHTASIDVKIMRIDKKQVTLSVFRQLDEESIFHVDGSLRGIPWGRVRYRWSDNKAGTDYHVVWQDGETIKRSPIPELRHFNISDVVGQWYEVDKLLSTWCYGDITDVIGERVEYVDIEHIEVLESVLDQLKVIQRDIINSDSTSIKLSDAIIPKRGDGKKIYDVLQEVFGEVISDYFSKITTTEDGKYCSKVAAMNLPNEMRMYLEPHLYEELMECEYARPEMVTSGVIDEINTSHNDAIELLSQWVDWANETFESGSSWDERLTNCVRKIINNIFNTRNLDQLFIAV